MRKYCFLLLLWVVTLGLVHAQPRPGRDYAVFFYVTDFQPGWPALPETKIEARGIKTELETEYGFQCELVANPTKQEMRTKIREYNARLTTKDQILYFFSMHGHYNLAGDRGYLVGQDGAVDDAYGDTWLSYDDLRTDLAPCKAIHILLALDACHSGSFGIRNKSAPEAPAYNQEDDCLTQFRKTMQYNGRQYCTSGNKDAKTPAKSLFAARFLEALRKRGDGKMLRFDDLEYWLGKIEMPQPETGTFAGHQPGGDFMFVRKNACTGTQPVNNPMDAAEEQTWKIAQNRQDGQIYLEEYPTGKHAREAENLPGNKGQHPASKPEAAPSVPAPFELTYKFNYDFVFDKYKYSPKIRPLGMKFPDKKIADHVKTSDYQYFEKQLKKRSNSPEKVSEMTFCLGYVLFVTKQFSLARQYFEKLINEKNSRFYEASNYYSGCIFFFENQTDASLECFEKLKGSLKYQKYAEKHRISVLYLQSKMNEVISSGTSIFDSIELGKRGDLPLLLGLAYLELKNYERADYYFELVRTDSLIDATLYADAELVLKVAANKIKLNKLDKAMIELLGGIYLKESSLAIQQATWYYRAQAYMANNDKVTARNCLAHSKAINYNPDAQEESALNYGKLSYELLYDQDAVTTLSTLIRHPIFGEEARYWLSQASKK